MVDCSIGWVAMEAETGQTDRYRRVGLETVAASRWPADVRADRATAVAHPTSLAHLALRSDNAAY